MRGQHFKGTENLKAQRSKQTTCKACYKKICTSHTTIAQRRSIFWSNNKIYYFKTPITYIGTPTNSFTLSFLTGPNEGKYYYDLPNTENLIFSLIPESEKLSLSVLSARSSQRGKQDFQLQFFIILAG